jgi:hypothetical protein
MPTMENDRRIGIREAAARLDRKPATLRSWERYGWLPPELLPERDQNGRRTWSERQVERLGEWMLERDMRPGKGLPHYKPTAEEIHEHVQKQRRPRGREEPVVAV